MPMKKTLSLSIISLTLLTGCGFKPLYGTHGQQPQDSPTLNTVAISTIPDQEGQYLRNNLMDRFYKDGYPTTPTLTLDIAPLSETKTELDLTKSSDATRAQLRLTTIMTLRDSLKNILLQRSIYTIASYNILGSEFATRVTQQSARKNAVDDLARQIEMNLTLYLNSKR